jgi:hypothetical protein
MTDNHKTNVEVDAQCAKSSGAVERRDRREVVQKLGKFAAYAAPFTVLAFTKKANAASAHGPVKHP